MQAGIRRGKKTRPEAMLTSLLTLLTLLAAGCSEKTEEPGGNAAPPVNPAKPSRVSSEPPPNSGKNRAVGVSLPERNGFYLTMQTALETAAQSNSITLDFQYADGQAAQQAKQIETFVQHKVDAILLCPADIQNSGAAVQKANAAQIPVFTVHLPIKQGSVKSHIGTDEARGGQLAAQKIAELLGDKGSVLLEEAPNDPNKDQAERARGFQEEMSRHSGIRVLHLWEPRPKGLPINAIFFLNDEAASQSLSALIPGKTDSVLVVGYGGEPRARAEIRKGQNYKADVCPDPALLGAGALDAIARSLRGEKPEPVVKVAPEIIDASNVDKP